MCADGLGGFALVRQRGRNGAQIDPWERKQHTPEEGGDGDGGSKGERRRGGVFRNIGLLSASKAASWRDSESRRFNWSSPRKGRGDARGVKKDWGRGGSRKASVGGSGVCPVRSPRRGADSEGGRKAG